MASRKPKGLQVQKSGCKHCKRQVTITILNHDHEDDDESSSTSPTLLPSCTESEGTRRNTHQTTVDVKMDFAHLVIPGLQKDKVLGSGSFGVVWSLKVQEMPCVGVMVRTPHILLHDKMPMQLRLLHCPDNIILKTSKLKPRSDFKDPFRLTDCFEREVFFLQALRDTRIVPRLEFHTVIEKDSIGVQIMQRFFGNTVRHLGEQQAKVFAKKKRRAVAYTLPQLDRILELAAILDAYQIIHGDLKHSNMLVEQQSLLSYQTRNHVPTIVVSDFGFAGEATCLGAGERWDLKSSTINALAMNSENQRFVQSTMRSKGRFSPLIGWMRAVGCNPARKRSDEILQMAPMAPKATTDEKTLPALVNEAPLPAPPNAATELTTMSEDPKPATPWFSLAYPIPSQLLPVFNRCQLYVSLLDHSEAYVLSWKDSKHTEVDRIEPLWLAKKMGLSQDLIKELILFCPRMKLRHLEDAKERRTIKRLRRKNRRAQKALTRSRQKNHE